MVQRTGSMLTAAVLKQHKFGLRRVTEPDASGRVSFDFSVPPGREAEAELLVDVCQSKAAKTILQLFPGCREHIADIKQRIRQTRRPEE